jgi:hypothetical protein
MSRSIDSNPASSHQTVRLSRGAHRSPDHGACVMELASMLAGERFGDHPQSVCRVIGAFLRGYNDAVDEIQRQDLYAYASKVVGTRGDRALTRARRDLCLRWAAQRAGKKPPRLKWLAYLSHPVTAGQQAARAATYRQRADSHTAALAFLDELIDIGAGCDVEVLSSELVREPGRATVPD